MKRLITIAMIVTGCFLGGCCSTECEPSICVPSGTITIDPATRHIINVEGPFIMENEATGQVFEVPPSYIYFPSRHLMEYTP